MKLFNIKNKFLANLIVCALATTFVLPVTGAVEPGRQVPQTSDEFLDEAVKMNSFGLASLAIQSGATNVNDVLLRLCEHSHYFVDGGISVIEFVEFLLEHGANVNIRQKDTERTPLMCVCLNSNLGRGSYTVNSELAEVLLKHGADVNAKDYHGWTPLMFACDSNNYSLAKVLLDHGAEVNACQASGYTPLMFSARFGLGGDKVKTVGLLLENGADVNKRGDDGESALSLAGKIILNKNLYTPEYVDEAKAAYDLLFEAVAKQH